MRRLVICLLVGLLLVCTLQAQEYTGITGMIHVPTADMAPEGDARIGVSFLNREFLPDMMVFDGEKYDSFNHYLAITPFSWIELAYVCTLQKGHKNVDPTLPVGYYFKDRYFAVKLRPLKEGKYWPAVAIGVHDPGNSVSHEDGKDYAYFQNYYIAATKHWRPGGHELGLEWRGGWRNLSSGFRFQLPGDGGIYRQRRERGGRLPVVEAPLYPGGPAEREVFLGRTAFSDEFVLIKGRKIYFLCMFANNVKCRR